VRAGPAGHADASRAREPLELAPFSRGALQRSPWCLRSTAEPAD